MSKVWISSDPIFGMPGLDPNCLQSLYTQVTKVVTVKPVLSGHSKKDQKLFFKTNSRLKQVKNIAECSKGSILQYLPPSLSYHLSLRSLFCQFFSGHLRQVLLYK